VPDVRPPLDRLLPGLSGPRGGHQEIAAQEEVFDPQRSARPCRAEEEVVNTIEKVAHTPGPWHVATGRETLIALAGADGQFGNLVHADVVMAGTTDVAFVPTYAGPGNARLIAAALEMYELLKRYSPQHAIALLAKIDGGKS
jgi:hypothetical protein